MWLFAFYAHKRIFNRPNNKSVPVLLFVYVCICIRAWKFIWTDAYSVVLHTFRYTHNGWTGCMHTFFFRVRLCRWCGVSNFWGFHAINQDPIIFTIDFQFKLQSTVYSCTHAHNKHENDDLWSHESDALQRTILKQYWKKSYCHLKSN